MSSTGTPAHMTLQAGHVVTEDSIVQSDERQPLLIPDSSCQYGVANATDAADEPVNPCQHELNPSHPDEFYAKLTATTINFFVSGFAMSAIGVRLSLCGLASVYLACVLR